MVDEPKLKLGVGDDESARGYVLRGSTVLYNSSAMGETLSHRSAPMRAAAVVPSVWVDSWVRWVIGNGILRQLVLEKISRLAPLALILRRT